MREARRVARPGANVAITAFGRPERCESTNVFVSIGQLLPAQSEVDEGGPALHKVGIFEMLASEAGLTPKESGYVELAEEYPDLETFLRGYLAAGPIVSAIRTLGLEPVRDALTGGVRPLMTASGGVRFEDEYRYLIATKRVTPSRPWSTSRDPTADRVTCTGLKGGTAIIRNRTWDARRATVGPHLGGN